MAEDSLLEKYLTSDQRSRLETYVEITRKPAGSGFSKGAGEGDSPTATLPEDLQWVPYPLEVSPGFLVELDSLVTQTGLQEGELLAKALTLLVLTYQAHDEGKSLAIVDEDLTIETIISGLGSPSNP